MIVKVCGMREAENIRQVEQTGADWMGFIDYEGSPRYVPGVPEYLPETVQKVGVFVNAPNLLFTSCSSLFSSLLATMPPPA
jgi:phosphoribosylanthranilate isomerase